MGLEVGLPRFETGEGCTTYHCPGKLSCRERLDPVDLLVLDG